jgi:hypothetical protein
MWSQMHIDLHLNCQLFSSDFNETWIFPSYCRKVLKYKISWKSVQWKPSYSLRSEMTKLIVAFHSFAEALKNIIMSVSEGEMNVDDLV